MCTWIFAAHEGRMKKALLAFDFDGVLADSLRPFAQAVRVACRRCGRSRPAVTRAAFLRLFDANFHESLAAAGLSPERLGLFQAVLQRELRKAAPRIALFPGVAGMLREVARLGRVVVVTSNFAAVAGGILARHRLAGFIDAISGAEEGGGKIARLRALREKHAPSRFFYVGDTLGDMLEGRAAGARTVAVLWGWHDERRLAAGRPDFTARTPADLPAIMRDGAGAGENPPAAG